MLVFGALAGVAAIAAVGVVAFGNAVRSALCLVLNFFCLALLYFTLNAELLGITQIMVYLGAIMVLFLFVIMLLNLGAPTASERFEFKRPIALLLGAGLFAMLAGILVKPLADFKTPNSPEGYGSPQAVGRILPTTYAWPLIMASVLLTIGVVGSILLAKRKL